MRTTGIAGRAPRALAVSLAAAVGLGGWTAWTGAEAATERSAPLQVWLSDDGGAPAVVRWAPDRPGEPLPPEVAEALAHMASMIEVGARIEVEALRAAQAEPAAATAALAAALPPVD